jgi:hypothetical protein
VFGCRTVKRPLYLLSQAVLVLRPEPHIGEAGEVQHTLEAIISVREVVPRRCRSRSRIDTAKNDIEAFRKNVVLIAHQRILRSVQVLMIKQLASAAR